MWHDPRSAAETCFWRELERICALDGNRFDLGGCSPASIACGTRASCRTREASSHAPFLHLLDSELLRLATFGIGEAIGRWGTFDRCCDGRIDPLSVWALGWRDSWLDPPWMLRRSSSARSGWRRDQWSWTRLSIASSHGLPSSGSKPLSEGEACRAIHRRLCVVHFFILSESCGHEGYPMRVWECIELTSICRIALLSPPAVRPRPTLSIAGKAASSSSQLQTQVFDRISLVVSFWIVRFHWEPRGRRP